MKNYDYHRPAEKVLLDSYRKQNRNKNRLLFLAVALTVGVIFCMISFAYGKIQVDIQKHIRTDGMTVSTYIENGTEEMAGQLHTLSYIAETGKEKFAGKLCNQTIKYCDCVVADETAFETMLCPAYTQIVGTYPKQENEIMLSVKTLKYLGISEPKVGMELNLDFYWNDLFQTKGTGQQTFQLSGYFTEYQNQGASSSIAFLSEKKLKESGAGWDPCRILLKPEKDSVSGMQMEQQLQKDIRLEEGQRIVSMDSVAYRAVEGMLGSYGFAALFSFLILLCMFLFIYNILNLSLEKDLQQYGLMEVVGVQQTSDYTSDIPADDGSCLDRKSCRRCHRQSGGTWSPALCHWKTVSWTGRRTGGDFFLPACVLSNSHSSSGSDFGCCYTSGKAKNQSFESSGMYELWRGYYCREETNEEKECQFQ
ncbi:hypothetical protein [Eubacterium ramulus]|uniref:hypothetical protein n=1 Tax=Eubacterium ramulus TaxID=39490 RepID=UPI0039942774